MGVHSLGHRARMEYSMVPLDSLSLPRVDSRELWTSTGIVTSDFDDSGALMGSIESGSPYGTPVEPTPSRDLGTAERAEAKEEEEEEFVWRHDASELIYGSIRYSAHYLGSTLVHVDSLEKSEAPKLAITKLKVSEYRNLLG